MYRIGKLTALTSLALVVIGGLAFAANVVVKEGDYTGGAFSGSHPGGFPPHPVQVQVKKIHGDKFVTKWSVDQSSHDGCGVTEYRKKSDPDIMPAKIKVPKEGRPRFTIKDKQAGFTVTGSFGATHVVEGEYTQAACDGADHGYRAFYES